VWVQNLVTSPRCGPSDGLQWVDKSLNDSRKNRVPNAIFFQPPTMRPPNTPRPPLCEVSPNKRSRVCGKRDAGIKIGVIARAEGLTDSTCRSILRRAPNQVSCLSNPRPGRPSKLTPSDQRLIFRVIVIQPKITAEELVAQTVPHVTKKTMYRFLVKSGIQKWRCKERPFLTPEHTQKRLEWARKYNRRTLEF
jgi:Transposase